MHTGYIHSIDTFGSVDGPGVPLRGIHAGLSHALPLLPQSGYMGTAKGTSLPDASTRTSGASALSEGVSCPSKHTGSQEITPEALLRQALRYRSYWRGGNGITVSGGEPLLQADFLCEFSSLPKNSTFTPHWTPRDSHLPPPNLSFSRLTTLLEHTDLVILDLKHIDPEKHRLLAGHSNESILSFARFLDQIHKPMWVRHVLVPGITDDPANLHGIRAFLDTLSNVEKVEILPYHTLGIYKWETLGIPYSLSDIRIPDENDLKRANQILLG